MVVHLNELPQRRRHLPPATLFDALIGHVNEILLQVRQELQSADHAVTCSCALKTQVSSGLQLACVKRQPEQLLEQYVSFCVKKIVTTTSLTGE